MHACVCVCVCVGGRTLRRMQKNPKSNVLEKRKDLWFLTLYGVTDHLENLIKATTFPEKNPKNQKNPTINIPNSLP